MNPKNRQQFLVALTLAVLALFVGVNFIYAPLAKFWSARSQSIAVLRRQVAEGKTLVQREPGIRSRWAQMRANALPDNTSLAEQQLLKAFDSWSRDSGAGVTGITPQWKSEATNYLTLNCRVEAGGDLGTLSRFIYDLEKDPMALRVDAVEITARDNNGQQLTLALQISGLALLNQIK